MDTDAETCISKANQFIEEKKFKQAIQTYTDWIQRTDLHTTNVSVIAKIYNNRGHAKYLAVDFDGAMDDYNESLKYDSSCGLGIAYYNRGTIEYRMGYFDKALEDMKMACKLDPESEEYQLALARSLEQLTASSTSK